MHELIPDVTLLYPSPAISDAVTGGEPQPVNIAPATSGMAAIATGQGPPLILVHGALGDYRQWRPIVEHLQSRFRVVALSRRYHWPNDPPAPNARYSVEGHRDDLLALLRSVGQPAHLAGHSYGAVVVLSAVLAEPSLASSMILIEPPLPGLLSPTTASPEDEHASRAAMVAALQAHVSAGENEAASVTLFDWVQGGAGGFAALPDVDRRQLLENVMTIGPTYATPPPQFTCAQLAQVRVPTLVLNGADSRMFYRRSGRAAVTCIPGAQLASIARAKHMVIAENPHATAASMLEFLAPAQPHHDVRQSG